VLRAFRGLGGSHKAGTPIGGLTTTPSFHAAGTYAEIASGGGNLNPSLPTNSSGDLFLAVGVGYLSGITPPAGWTQQAGPATASSQNSYIWTRDTRSSGGESTAPAFAIDDRGGVRIYTFSNVATSAFFEALSTATFGSGTRTNPSVGPLSDHRLACLAWAGFSTNGSGPCTPGGSPSGGTWTEVAEALGSLDIFFHELQTADMTAGGTISGGTTTVAGANQANGFGFALVGI